MGVFMGMFMGMLWVVKGAWSVYKGSYGGNYRGIDGHARGMHELRAFLPPQALRVRVPLPLRFERCSALY